MNDPYGLENFRNNYAVLVLVRVYTNIDDPGSLFGYVFVRSTKFGNDAKWKLPGGHNKLDKDKTPLETAVREIRKKTGLALEATAFGFKAKWLSPKRDHGKLLFAADVSLQQVLSQLNGSHPENGGEKPCFFNLSDCKKLLSDFLLEHVTLVPEFVASPKPGSSA